MAMDPVDSIRVAVRVRPLLARYVKYCEPVSAMFASAHSRENGVKWIVEETESAIFPTVACGNGFKFGKQHGRECCIAVSRPTPSVRSLAPYDPTVL